MLLSAVLHTHSLRWTIPAALMLGSSPIFITVWAAVRSVTLLLPRRLYTLADDRLYSAYQRLVLFFFNTYTGVKVKLYGDASILFLNKENIVLICNHQSTVDWVIADMLASVPGSIGSIRYILKDGLKFFPLYGFYFRQHSCIYVKRAGKFKQEKAERQLKELKDNNIPVWLVIFPEGTRMNPENADVISRSKQTALEQGCAELENVLMPKVKAFQLCVQQLQDHVQAVYDVTIAYSNTSDPNTGQRLPAPGMPEFLTGVCPELHLDFERISLTDIPQNDVELSSWLYSRFQRKDRLMAHFYSDNPEEHGKFPGECSELKISKRTTVPSFLFFGSCLTLLLATPEGRSAYWRVGVFGSVAGCIFMCFRS